MGSVFPEKAGYNPPWKYPAGWINANAHVTISTFRRFADINILPTI